MQQLDKIERRLLVELSRDSRASCSSLARKLGIATERVRSRLIRLKDDDIIRYFHTSTHSSVLGFRRYRLLFKLRAADTAGIEQFLGFLAAHPKITWLAKMEGVYDVGAILRIRELGELELFLVELLNSFANLITKQRLSACLARECRTKEYLLNSEAAPEVQSAYDDLHTEPISIDEVSCHILELLGENSRMSAVALRQELQKRVKGPGRVLTREAVLKRVKRLERDGIINGYNIILNHRLLGHQLYKIIVWCNFSDKRAVQKFLRDCRKHRNVIGVYRMVGDWHYELDLATPSGTNLGEIVDSLLRRYAGVVEDYVSLSIESLYKYNAAAGLAQSLHPGRERGHLRKIENW